MRTRKGNPHQNRGSGDIFRPAVYTEAPPFDYFYTKEYEKGLQLYSKGVLIMDKCADLLPDYFSFVKGLVDSEDLSLNISRETLQHDGQFKAYSKAHLKRRLNPSLKKCLRTNARHTRNSLRRSAYSLNSVIYNDYGYA